MALAIATFSVGNAVSIVFGGRVSCFRLMQRHAACLTPH
jgi:hypothetical protein